MKNFIISNSISYISRYNNFSETKLKEIKYGLESIYLTISKFIVIGTISIILGIFKEMLIFSLIYNIVRLPSFGLHASKSWICLISSLICFIAIPYISLNISINIYIKLLILVICILLMFKNSPADTKKRPIVSKKRRARYKFISVIISIVFAFISIIIKNNFISNCLLFSLILQNIIIAPTTYKVFGLPYNNYIEFLKNHPEYVTD